MARPTAPVAYVQGVIPTETTDLSLFTSDELRKVASSIAMLVLMTPQACTSAPKVLVDAMPRLARSPWRPAGGTIDAWVYYDQPTASWKFLL